MVQNVGNYCYASAQTYSTFGAMNKKAKSFTTNLIQWILKKDFTHSASNALQLAFRNVVITKTQIISDAICLT